MRLIQAVLSGFLLVAASGSSAFAQSKPARTYALAGTPLQIYDRLADLKIGTIPAIPDDERKLLAKIWELKGKQPAAAVKMEDADLLEALLFAFGVEKPEERKKYHEQCDTLLTKARGELKNAKNDRERGEKLMRFLHAGPLSKGYSIEQTSFSTIFDTGKHNCVSSTALYYLIGSRLGLKLQPISIPGSGFLPGHAALDMIDGNKRLQVEPTNPDGFDWQTKISRPGVIVFGLVPDRKNGHEVDAAGIAAMIYSNRAVAFSKEKPPKILEAARCCLSALVLDPVDEAATNNLLSLFINGGPQLAEEKKYEEAVRIMAFGVSIAPKSNELRNNQRVVWTRYIDAVMETNKDDEVLALIRRASEAIKDDRDFQSASSWYRRLGQKRIKANDWEAGLAVVARGVKVLPEADGKKLLEWRGSLFRQWSEEHLDKGDADGSRKVLARAYALDPKDKQIADGIAYHTVQVLRKGEEKGLPAAFEQYRAVCKQFPDVKAIAEVGWSHAVRAVNRLAEAKKFPESIEAVAKYEPLLVKPEQRTELTGIAYDGWARHLSKDKRWQASLDKYAEGLKACPKDRRLTQNAVATIDEWAQPEIKAKKWDEAIAIYKTGLKHFPGDSHLQQNLKYCETMKEKQK